MKLQQRRVRLGVRKRFFTERVVGHWGRLWCRGHGTEPAQVQEVLDNALRHMGWFLGGPVWSQELDLMILMGPFQLRICYDSMKHK